MGKFVKAKALQGGLSPKFVILFELRVKFVIRKELGALLRLPETRCHS